MRGRPALVLLAAQLSAGCGAAPPSAPAPVAVSLSLVRAASDGAPAAPFRDGDEALLIAGAQGGFHVWMAFRVTHAPAGDALLSRRATRTTDGALVLRSQPIQITIGSADEGGDWELPMAVPMFMCPTPIGVAVADESVTYEITLTTMAGLAMTTGDVTLIPRCPSEAGPTRDLCLRICFG